MITLVGVIGAFLMLGSLIMGDLKVGLLGLALCLSAAFLDGWIAHRRERLKTIRRARRRRNALDGWR